MYFQKFNQVPQNKTSVQKIEIILENYIIFNNIFLACFTYFF